MTRVAVVSGSNKGIGFAIVRGLCKQFEGDVYLTSRDIKRGQEAVKELEKEGLHPKFHQLDIDSQESIEALKTFIQEKYGGLDVLVNNAGMAYKENSPAPFVEQTEVATRVNFLGTLQMSRTLFPILKSHARVVHVSSFVCRMAYNKCGADVQNKIKSCSTIEEVEKLMQQFISDVKKGDFKEKGWPESAYGMSKVGVSLITPIQQKELDKDTSRTDICVNACDPGYVDTDMSSHKGHLTTDQGAETPLYAALLPANTKTPRGEFIQEKKVEQWN